MITERSRIDELKVQANKLRKASQFSEALPIYKTLWEETHDVFDGSGYLSCLRKLRKFEHALPFAALLFKEYPSFEWARKEVAWTLIQGKLLSNQEDSSLSDIIKIAKRVIETDPDFLAKKVTVFAVLKHAKKRNDWACVAKWIDLLDPTLLSDAPMSKEDRIDGWSEQERWFNYKINSCLENNQATTALEICDGIQEKYQKHSRFFLRLRALALRALKKPAESMVIYRDLCSKGKTEWWLLHEYGSLLAETNAINESLTLFCKAALSCPKGSLAVSLYQDMGALFLVLQAKETAYIHYSLAAAIRAENGWPRSSEIEAALKSIQSEIGLQEQQPINQLVKSCRKIWQSHFSASECDTRQVREGLRGRISMEAGRKACFINCKDGLSAICIREEVPPGISDRDPVIFDAVPSFDKKKNRESWRAKCVRKLT